MGNQRSLITTCPGLRSGEDILASHQRDGKIREAAVYCLEDSEDPPAQGTGYRQEGMRSTSSSLQGRLQKGHTGDGHGH